MSKPKSTPDNPLCLVWLRRDLRLHDHAALAHALELGIPIQPVFIFDTAILKDFPNKQDRRLSFIAGVLHDMSQTLAKRGGNIWVLHGDAATLIPQLAIASKATHVMAAEDYEPYARKRDAAVAHALRGKAQVQLVKDQLIFAPGEVLRGGESPYKVYSAYAKSWKAALTQDGIMEYGIRDRGRYAPASLRKTLNMPVLDPAQGPEALLQQVGYSYRKDALWPVTGADKRLQRFVSTHGTDYARGRNMVGEDVTSRLSPYLRFGLVSVRQCVREAVDNKLTTWLGELVWREFYAMILYHFPESVEDAWKPNLRGKLEWSRSAAHFAAWQEGKTGYPIVDAGMRQLVEEGWMHNRARLITASFLCKHLRIDWRRGEAHFGQYLMDYDLASNVGNWQWCASTGTDAQPWFRIFNPMLQSRKFDPNGEYIRRYVLELKQVSNKNIHMPPQADYTAPIVDHPQARAEALAMFRQATSKND